MNKKSIFIILVLVAIYTNSIKIDAVDDLTQEITIDFPNTVDLSLDLQNITINFSYSNENFSLISTYLFKDTNHSKFSFASTNKFTVVNSTTWILSLNDFNIPLNYANNILGTWYFNISVYYTFDFSLFKSFIGSFEIIDSKALSSTITNETKTITSIVNNTDTITKSLNFNSEFFVFSLIVAIIVRKRNS